jgi:hypothetical protein
MASFVDRVFEIPELDTPILFKRRPLSLPEDLRPSWRIGLLVLLLSSCCRGARSSRARLHVLSWGIRTDQTQAEVKAAIKGNLNPRALIVRFDPFLDRALDFAIGEGLIKPDGGKTVVLTASGKELAEEISKSDDLFVPEKAFVKAIGLHVTEKLVNEMFGWET